MPKAPNSPPLPLNGLFPIAKPSGPSSMKVIDSITPLLLDSKLFYDPDRMRQYEREKRKKNLTHMGLKIGQGGTLDPLADGVLVIGVNRGTKHLNRFLECSKEYESDGLFGAATTTYDSEGPVMSTYNFDGITREDVERVLDQFRGKINQTPPIFSALKMDGKPLYEYARESKPLPRPIPVRECTVSIDLIDFRPASTSPGDGGHEWTWPKERLSSEEKTVFRRLTDIVHKASESAHDTKSDPAVPDLNAEEVPETSVKTGLRPPSFKVRMTVSSGTYVRSIVHDIGLALGCGAHVVTLTRTRQGEFSLYGDEEGLDAEQEVKQETEIKEEAEKEKSAGSTSQPGQALSEAVDIKPSVKTDSAEEMTEEETAMNAESTEEDMMNAFSSSDPGPSTNASSGPSGGCIPWSVWTRALAERDEMLTAEQAEKEEARANGIQGDEYRQMYSDKAVMARRRDRPYREWEVEMLKRFVSVPVPIGGSHGTTRYR